MIQCIDLFTILQFLNGTLLPPSTLTDIHRIYIQMINKIQNTTKATLKTHLIVTEPPLTPLNNAQEEILSVHGYFVMLRHIFQKNKELMRKRNDSSLQNKTYNKMENSKIEQNQEKERRIHEQNFGFVKNSKTNNSNIITQKQSRYYRPYRAKNLSLNVTTKGLSTSVPKLQQQKDEGFQPIGQRYHEFKETKNGKKRSFSKSRTQFSTCINFYPKYQRKDSNTKSSAIQPTKSQLRKQRRTLFVNHRTIGQLNEQESLRSSHKSHLSMRTETSQVPSPW